MSGSLTVGLLAHVDAGKTTLSEAMLYQSGTLRRLGRVDHRDAFLDTDVQERERGITIFSKQAELSWQGRAITLVDTPGHVDFSAKPSAPCACWIARYWLSAPLTACRGTPPRYGACCKATMCPRFCSSTRWISPARTAAR